MNRALDQTLAERFGCPNKKGDLGIELEIEGENLPVEFEGWATKHEGSLRGRGGRPIAHDLEPDTPREYVFPRPLTLDTAKTRLAALERKLSRPPCEVRLTPRASTHIHINMGGETLRTTLAFLMVFTAIEPILLRQCGPERNGNLFCLPSYETGDLPEWVGHLAKYLEWQQRDRYAVLNVNAVPQLGSLEVRCFPNTIDAERIATWAEWLLNIRALARSADPTLEKLMSLLETDAPQIIGTVFHKGLDAAACAPQTPHTLFNFGVEQAYEVFVAAQPLFKERAAKEKPAEKKRLLGEPVPMPRLRPDFGELMRFNVVDAAGGANWEDPR